MTDYIKREDALELFEMVLDSYKDSGIQNITMMLYIAPKEFNLSEDEEIAEFNSELDGWRNNFMEIESADAVPVVRCKDCKHWLKGDGSCFPHADYNDFCSNGERKDDESMDSTRG